MLFYKRYMLFYKQHFYKQNKPGWDLIRNNSNLRYQKELKEK